MLILPLVKVIEFKKNAINSKENKRIMLCRVMIYVGHLEQEVDITCCLPEKPGGGMLSTLGHDTIPPRYVTRSQVC